jgi:hypothetical protein
VSTGGVEYHYVITLTGAVGPDSKQATVGTKGIVVLDPVASTRAGVCDDLIEHVQSVVLARTGSLLDDPNIVFFQLEPNHL